MAAFNILAQWYWHNGPVEVADEYGRVHLSIAQFSL
jgi:hypothetical protein